MKKILIDGRFIGVGDSMTRYTLELLRGILELDHENEYTLLVRPVGVDLACEALGIPNSKLQMPNEKSLFATASDGVPQRAGKLEIRNLKLVVLDIPHYSLAEQTILLRFLNQEKFDLVHFTQFNHPVRYQGKYVVTIHDLTLLGHLHREPFHKRIAFGQVMKSAAHNSAKIITISKTSKQEIVEYYGVPEEKIAVTYLAVDKKYNPEVKSQNQKIDEFKKKYNIVNDYFLYTGMWKKHKNILRMLKAFAKLKTDSQSQISNLQLVLVGKIDKEEPEVLALINKINQRISKFQTECHSNPVEESQNHVCDKEGEILRSAQDDNRTMEQSSNAIITAGFIDEIELPIAYAGAMAYIIPSLSEGFGLPPLEAMACGTPVLSSNLSAMPEILGEAALYFDPYNLDDMAAKMHQIALDGQLRADLIAKGLEQAKKYDWATTAKQTLGAYKDVLFERSEN